MNTEHPQLLMFRLNLQLLMGILACAGIGLIILIASWTTIRAWLFSRSQSSSLSRFERGKLDAHGRTLPPMGPGVCDSCGKAMPRVYHLPSGKRQCQTCFDASMKE